MCTFRKWLNKILNQVHWTPELSHVTIFDHFFHNKLKSAFSIKYTWQTFDCLHSMVMSLKNETYLWNIIIRIRKNKKQNKLCLILKKKKKKKKKKRHLETNIIRIPGLPCGSVVKNLSANAGDTNWIPDWWKSHIPWGN